MNGSGLQLSNTTTTATVAVSGYDEYGKVREGFVAHERPLTIYIDKREIITLMTMGNAPEMLVLGWLRNQNLVQHIDDIQAIQVDWETGSVAVTMHQGITQIDNKLAHKTVTTGCGQGTVFGNLMASVSELNLPKVRLKQSQIYAVLNRLNAHNAVYKQAGGVHGCALCSQEHIDYFVEDVGRHNAVDAIAGYMWLNNITGRDKLFYTTGRLTSEMVIKVAQMGIPILLSRSGVTQMGLAIARQVGVVMLARAKGKHFVLHHGYEQFEFDAIPPVL